MKAKRRDVIKGLIAGAAGLGIAGMEFACGTAAKAVNSSSASAFDEPVKFIKVGNLIYTAGFSCNPGEAKENTIEAHTAVAMAKVKAALEEAGSNMTKALKAVVFLDDIANYQPMNKAYGAAWTQAGGRAPNRSCIAVPKGGIPGGSLLKVEVIAHV